MITNAAPRPWVPGTPVRLNCVQKDIDGGMPEDWGGKPIANGSKLRIMDKDKTYIYDEENKSWHVWTQDSGGSGGGGSSGGGGDATGNVASDDAVDEALDTLYPTPGGIAGDDEPPRAAITHPMMA